jgi:DNA polymerase V
MIDILCCDMYGKNLIPRLFTWWVSYDYKSLDYCPNYDGPLAIDFYGRIHPRHSTGRIRTLEPTNVPDEVTKLLTGDFDRKTDHRLLFRRLGICACEVMTNDAPYQLDFFTDYESKIREQKITGAMREIRLRYGANSVLKGINFLEGATTKERNTQIGGHRA